MFSIVDIIDVMCDHYEDTPTWKEMNLGARTVLEVGQEFEGVPILRMERDGVVVDFQLLRANGDNLFIFLNSFQEPLNRAMLDELTEVIHSLGVFKKKSVYAVVELQYAIPHTDPDAVSLEIPLSVKDGKVPSSATYAVAYDEATAQGLTPIVALTYTDKKLSELLANGFKILDHLYAV